MNAEHSGTELERMANVLETTGDFLILRRMRSDAVEAVNSTHSDWGYVIEAVSGFIEQLDGIGGRQGLIFVGAPNDVTRCDPSIVRAGLLNRTINVSMSEPKKIEKMLRVRLHGQLADEPLEEIAQLLIGATGADIERIVKDGIRAARHEERRITVDDLRRSVQRGGYDMPEEMLKRVSIHEAGHIVVRVLNSAPDDIYAVLGDSAQAAGFVASHTSGFAAGTIQECRQMLQSILVGRAADELELGFGGNGVGGQLGSDLAGATTIAAAMVSSYGHSGPHPLLFIADHRETANILRHSYLREAAHDELSAAFAESKHFLEENRRALDEITRPLQEKKHIDGVEVSEIIQANTNEGRGAVLEGAEADAVPLAAQGDPALETGSTPSPVPPGRPS